MSVSSLQFQSSPPVPSSFSCQVTSTFTLIPLLYFILLHCLKRDQAFVLLFWCFARHYPSRFSSQQSPRLQALGLLPVLYCKKFWSLRLSWHWWKSTAQRSRSAGITGWCAASGWHPPHSHFRRFCFGKVLVWSCGDHLEHTFQFNFI